MKIQKTLFSLCLGWILLLGLVAGAAQAHIVGQSYLYLQVYEDSISGRFEIALVNLNPALGLAGTEYEITPENLEENLEYLRDYYRENVFITTDQGPAKIDFTESELLNVHEGYALLSFDLGDLEGLPEKLYIQYSVLFEEDPDHRGYLLVEYNWGTGIFANENKTTGSFAPDDRQEEFTVPVPNRGRGFMAVLQIGMKFLWAGLHHMLFLFALLLPVVLRRKKEDAGKSRWMRNQWTGVESFAAAAVDAAKIIAVLTLAHGIALVLAGFAGIALPTSLVGTMIALSIVVAAADLLFPFLRGRVLPVAFFFGLFHGFGFAAAMAKTGLFAENVGLAILAFLLGVEIAQIVLVLVLLPILFFVRNWPLYQKVVVPLGAIGLIILSGIWVVERAFGIDLPVGELLPPEIRKWIP